MEGEIPGSRKIKSHVGVTHLHAGGSSVGYNRREFGGPGHETDPHLPNLVR